MALGVGRLVLPNIRILHTHNDIIIAVQKCAVEGHNVLGVAAVHDLELSNDALPHLALCLDVNDLRTRLDRETRNAEFEEEDLPCEP